MWEGEVGGTGEEETREQEKWIDGPGVCPTE